LGLEILKLKNEGYNEESARARLCQDIILQGIAHSSLCKNTTIKGGVVMRSISNDARRATQDVDIDFIRYSLSDESIDVFIEKINNIDGLLISRIGYIEELKHQDYKGKRIYVKIQDSLGFTISSKMDIGVHADLSIKQDEYCFDICYSDDSASLLMNTPAQMFAEKLKSLIRFGARTTRYKDIYDIYYLLDIVDNDELQQCIKKYIFEDVTLHIDSYHKIYILVDGVFANTVFLERLQESNKNWINVEDHVVLREILEFIKQQYNVGSMTLAEKN